MRGSGEGDDDSAREPQVLDFRVAFDRRETVFTKAVAGLNDILASPPDGPRSYELLSGGVTGLSKLMRRCLPLTTAQEARLAQLLQLSQVLDDQTSVVLGNAVLEFIDGLQGAFDRSGMSASHSPASTVDPGNIRQDRVRELSGSVRLTYADVKAAGLAAPSAPTHAPPPKGSVARLRILQQMLKDVDWKAGDADNLTRLLAMLIDEVEQATERLAAAEFDAAVRAFEEETRLKTLPEEPTDAMLEAGARVGFVGPDAVRRIYEAMASEFLSARKRFSNT